MVELLIRADCSLLDKDFLNLRKKSYVDIGYPTKTS